MSQLSAVYLSAMFACFAFIQIKGLSNIVICVNGLKDWTVLTFCKNGALASNTNEHTWDCSSQGQRSFPQADYAPSRCPSYDTTSTNSMQFVDKTQLYSTPPYCHITHLFLTPRLQIYLHKTICRLILSILTGYSKTSNIVCCGLTCATWKHQWYAPSVRPCCWIQPVWQ